MARRINTSTLDLLKVVDKFISDYEKHKFAELRHYLNEAHQFAAMSPQGKANIEAALAILDELEATE